MSAFRLLLTLLLSGLLAATPVAASVVLPVGAEVEAAEAECLAPARLVAVAPRATPATPVAARPSSDPRRTASDRPAAEPAPTPVRIHVLHCVWRE